MSLQHFRANWQYWYWRVITGLIRRTFLKKRRYYSRFPLLLENIGFYTLITYFSNYRYSIRAEMSSTPVDFLISIEDRKLKTVSSEILGITNTLPGGSFFVINAFNGCRFGATSSSILSTYVSTIFIKWLLSAFAMSLSFSFSPPLKHNLAVTVFLGLCESSSKISEIILWLCLFCSMLWM